MHKQRVQAIALSNWEKYVISGDKQGKIVYTNVKMKQKNEFEGHSASCIRDLSFSCSSMKFASCADDSTAKVFDFATSQLEMTFTEH